VLFYIFQSNRVADYECYGYEASVGRCRATKLDNLRSMGCNVPEFRPTENLYKTGPGYSLYNETDIMWEIKNYGPVQGEIRQEKYKFFKFDIDDESLKSI
jgi:hypothetical protein